MGQKMVTPPVAFLGANYWMIFGEEYYHKFCIPAESYCAECEERMEEN